MFRIDSVTFWWISDASKDDFVNTYQDLEGISLFTGTSVSSEYIEGRYKWKEQVDMIYEGNNKKNIVPFVCRKRFAILWRNCCKFNDNDFVHPGGEVLHGAALWLVDCWESSAPLTLDFLLVTFTSDNKKISNNYMTTNFKVWVDLAGHQTCHRIIRWPCMPSPITLNWIMTELCPFLDLRLLVQTLRARPFLRHCVCCCYETSHLFRAIR